MKSFRPALTLCLSFLPARERRGLGTKWAPRFKRRVLEGNVSWMGQGGTPWLSYYPGDSSPEQVVHPSQSSEGNSWGGGR